MPIRSCRLIAGGLGIALPIVQTLRRRNILGVRSRRMCHGPIGRTGGSRRRVVCARRRRRIVRKFQRSCLYKAEEACLLRKIAKDKGARICVRVVHAIIKRKERTVILVPRVTLACRAIVQFCHYFNSEISVVGSELSTKRHCSRVVHTGENRISIVVKPHSTLFAPFPSLKLVIVSRRRRPACGDRRIPHCRTERITIRETRMRSTDMILKDTAPSVRTVCETELNRCRLCRVGGHSRVRRVTAICAMSVHRRLGGKGQSVLDRGLRRLVRSELGTGRRVVLFLGHEKCSNFISYERYNRMIGYPRYGMSLSMRGNKGVIYRCYKCRRPGIAGYPRYKSECVKRFHTKARRVRSVIGTEFPRTEMLHVSVSAAGGGSSRRRVLSTFTGRRTSVLIKARVVMGKRSFPGIALINTLTTSVSLCASSCHSNRQAFRLLARTTNHTKENSEPNRIIVRACSPRRCTVRTSTTRSCRTFCRGRVHCHDLVKCPPIRGLVTMLTTYRSRTLLRGTYGCLGRCVLQVGKRTRLGIVNPTDPKISGVGSVCQEIVCMGTPRCQALIMLGSEVRRCVRVGSKFRGVEVRFSFGPVGL